MLLYLFAKTMSKADVISISMIMCLGISKKYKWAIAVFILSILITAPIELLLGI